MDDLRTKFGKRVKAIRQKRKLSQEELAERDEIAVTNMGKIERGESFVTAVTLEKLANVLGVKVQDFFKFDMFVSVDEMKADLNTDNMTEDEIKQLYKFYKLYINFTLKYISKLKTLQLNFSVSNCF